MREGDSGLLRLPPDHERKHGIQNRARSTPTFSVALETLVLSGSRRPDPFLRSTVPLSAIAFIRPGPPGDAPLASLDVPQMPHLHQSLVIGIIPSVVWTGPEILDAARRMGIDEIHLMHRNSFAVRG